jgi:hypothetical protein
MKMVYLLLLFFVTTEDGQVPVHHVIHARGRRCWRCLPSSLDPLWLARLVAGRRLREEADAWKAEAGKLQPLL